LCIGCFGADCGLITVTFHFSQSGTVIKTITVLSGFSLTYPTTARQGIPFAWSVSGGNPYESWYATTTAPNHTRIPASGTFTLDSAGSATYTNGDFGTDTGVINVTFYFIQSGTVSRTINVLPAFQLTYPTTANELIPFSWSVANGQPYEAWYATTTAPHNLRIPATGYLYLESDGSKSYTNGDFGIDTGNINLTFYFSQSGNYNKTINVIPEPPQTIIIFPKTVNVNQVVSWTIESASTGAYIDISATGPAPFTNPQARVNQLTGYQSYPTIGPINYGPETPIYFYSHLNPRVTFTATGYYTVTFVTHSGYEGPAYSTPYVTHVRHVRVI
jgi:hypothetical protein